MAGKEHVISMEEFHPRYSVRRVIGKTSSSATDEAETKSIQISYPAGGKGSNSKGGKRKCEESISSYTKDTEGYILPAR